jgi:2-haloacid dehalogenase
MPAGGVRAVVFDLGKVLLDWDPYYLYRKLFPDDAAVAAFLAETGLLAMHTQFDAGRPFADGLAELAARFPHHIKALHAWNERWEESIPGPIAGTVAILDELHRRGVPLYALTNYAAEKFPAARVRFPFLNRFRHIVVSGEVGVVKPDPRIFDILLRWMAVPAHDALFIDDMAANVEAAKRLGFRTAQFETPERLRAALELHSLL